MITTVVFDLFSTLVHVEGKKTYLKLFTELGLTPEQMHTARRTCMMENFDSLGDLANRLVPGSTIDVRKYNKEVLAEIDSAQLYPETKDVLVKLRREGYRIGMISNLATPYKNVFFDFYLHKKIDSYVFSCDVGMYKPDPQIYLHLLREMGVRPEQTLMTGDKEHSDVLGPRGVGMNTMHLDRTGEASHSILTLDGVFEYL